MDDPGWLVVPGAPLEAGGGWRVWYSRRGDADFAPAKVEVRRDGVVEDTDQSDWDLRTALPKAGRRVGVLELRLENPSPGSLYEVNVPEAGTVPFRWRSLPLPWTRPGTTQIAARGAAAATSDGVTFLFASCFYQPNDREGTYAAAVRDLCTKNNVTFKVLSGDQVYADWPLALGADRWSMFADRYEKYWSDAAYQDLLRASPNLFLCDDHEFWNNYPERQMHLLHTWLKEGRRLHREAALRTYEQFQTICNPGGRKYFSLNLGPISMFVADARSERQPLHPDDQESPIPHFFSETQWGELEQWFRGLSGPGILVLAQPLFQEEGGPHDYTLANFSHDYARLCGLIDERITGKRDGEKVGDPHDLLILTGDIHWARHAVARVAGTRTGVVHELIASPASRVTVGPLAGARTPPVVPPRIVTTGTTGQRIWTIETTVSEELTAGDSNVALVTVAQGTNERLRVTLSIWSVRPWDSRNLWDKVRGVHAPIGLLKQLLSTEIDLG